MVLMRRPSITALTLRHNGGVMIGCLSSSLAFLAYSYPTGWVWAGVLNWLVDGYGWMAYIWPAAHDGGIVGWVC